MMNYDNSTNAEAAGPAESPCSGTPLRSSCPRTPVRSPAPSPEAPGAPRKRRPRRFGSEEGDAAAGDAAEVLAFRLPSPARPAKRARHGSVGGPLVASAAPSGYSSMGESSRDAPTSGYLSQATEKTLLLEDMTPRSSQDSLVMLALQAAACASAKESEDIESWCEDEAMDVEERFVERTRRLRMELKHFQQEFGCALHECCDRRLREKLDEAIECLEDAFRAVDTCRDMEDPREFAVYLCALVSPVERLADKVGVCLEDFNGYALDVQGVLMELRAEELAGGSQAGDCCGSQAGDCCGSQAGGSQAGGSQAGAGGSQAGGSQAGGSQAGDGGCDVAVSQARAPSPGRKVSWLVDGGRVGVPCVVVPWPVEVNGRPRPAGGFMCATVGVWNLARPEVPVLHMGDRGVTWDVRDGQDMTGLDEVNYALYRAHSDVEFWRHMGPSAEGAGKKGLKEAARVYKDLAGDFVKYLEGEDVSGQSNMLVRLVLSAAAHGKIGKNFKSCCEQLRLAIDSLRGVAVAKMERGELLWYLIAAVEGVVI